MNQLQSRLSRLSGVQRYRSYNHLLGLTINICLSSFLFGYVTGYFNSIKFDDIVRIYNIKDYSLSTIQGVLTGVISLTGGVGAYFTSSLLLNFSRKECFQIISTCTIVICLVMMIPNLTVLFIARLIQGLLTGVAAVLTPLYIRQFSPVELAGSLCPWYGVGFVMGLVFSFTITFLCSLIMPVDVYWRIVFGFPIVTCAIQLYKLKYVYPYDTPKYLVLQAKEQEARDLLAVIYRDEFVDDVLKDLKKALLNMGNRVSRISKMTEEDLPNLERMSLKQNLNELERRLTEIEMYEFKNEPVQPANKLLLQTNPLAKITAIHVALTQQGAAAGPIISYSGQIVGILIPLIQKAFPVFVNLASMAGSFLCIYIMNKYGRKEILVKGQYILGSLLIMLTICLLSYNFHDDSNSNSLLLKVMICVFFVAIRLTSSATAASIGSIYISETVQPSFMPVAVMVNWWSGAVINTVFPILSHWLGNPSYIFLGFGVYSILGGVINQIIMVQTKNKKEYEINAQIAEKWRMFKEK